MEILGLVIFGAYSIAIINIFLFLYIISPRDDGEVKSGTVNRVNASRYLILLSTFINFIILVLVLSLIIPKEFIEFLIAAGPLAICLTLSIIASISAKKLAARAKTLGM